MHHADDTKYMENVHVIDADKPATMPENAHVPTANNQPKQKPRQ